jgi:protein-S-isoprenylcysteine O-methyltransferase Ste14
VHTLLDITVTIISLVIVGQFTWALRAHFSSKKVPAGTVLISVTVVTTTLVYLLLIWWELQPPVAQVAGALIQLGAAWLFWAAISASSKARLRLAFDEENPDSIVSTGPYKYVRHPFYTSYLIFWIGFAIAAWHWWVLPFLAALGVIYVVAALGEQKKFANSGLAAAYADYRSRTGFFWPRFGA